MEEKYSLFIIFLVGALVALFSVDFVNKLTKSFLGILPFFIWLIIFGIIGIFRKKTVSIGI